MIERLSLPLSSMQLREVWAAIDIDRSGAIDYREFAIALFPEVEVLDTGHALQSGDDRGSNGAIRPPTMNHAASTCSRTSSANSEMHSQGSSSYDFSFVERKSGRNSVH